MKKMLVVSAAALMTGFAFAQSVNVYNWSDYIDEEVTIDGFTNTTGIDLTYDVYDSNEILEAKMSAGGSGYDVAVPTSDFLARGFEEGYYQELDLSRLSNLGNQDASTQAFADSLAEGANRGIVYMWGTTGVAYNVDAVAARLGDDAPVDSWGLILDPENAAALADCGVAILDAPTDVLPNVMAYLGLDGTSQATEDLVAAGRALEAVRPHLAYINSSQSIDDMATGEICAAIMWSGDAFQAAYRASDELENGITIEYVIPKEGTNMWFDMFAIPADARNLDEAYAFIDYMLDADVAAANVNYVWYASGNEAAKASIDPEILEHPGIYPTPAAQENLFLVPVYTPETDRVVGRVWGRFTGAN